VGGGRPAAGPAPPLALDAALEADAYAARIAEIKACIARGETYQVNFTFPLRGHDNAPAAARFGALVRSQRCRYGALIETDAFAVCSASPELFFRQTGDHLVCRPMKGTARRGRWAGEDADIAGRLQASLEGPRGKRHDCRHDAQRPRPHRAHRHGTHHAPL
jgi:para-aminobenzoate synthetase / 4-amino-4-deoxychorismate lyase